MKQPIQDIDNEAYIEVSGLAELWDLRQDIGSRIIVDVGPDGEPELLIYDDYLE